MSDAVLADAPLAELAEHIQSRQPQHVLSTKVEFGELTVEADRNSIVPFLEFLKTDPNCRFSTLVDLTAVDYPEREARFDVVYHLLSMYQNQRLRVKIQVREEELVPSVTLSLIHI